jgi:hypothetical protein
MPTDLEEENMREAPKEHPVDPEGSAVEEVHYEKELERADNISDVFQITKLHYYQHTQNIF